MTTYLTKLIREYTQKHPDLSLQDLAQKMIDNEYLGFTVDDLSKKIESALGSIHLVDKKIYEIKNNQYHFNSEKYGSFTFSVDTIDSIFASYSSKGLNWSQNRMMTEFNLTPFQWMIIKSQLNLVKGSNVFSDYTIEQTPIEKVPELINLRIQELFNTTGKLTESEYQKVLNKEYKKSIKVVNNKNFYVDNIVSQLASLIPKLDRSDYLIQATNQHSEEEIVAVIADLHAGLKVKSYRKRPEYNLEVLADRLSQVAEAINSYKARKVTLLICGDLVETISGLNHLTSFRELEFGQYGAQTIFTVVDIIRKFIAQIANVKRIFGVSGNHDRLSANAKEDRRGDAAMIAFKFLEEGYNKKIKVEYKYDFVDFEFMGINMIATHGHLQFMKYESSAIKKLMKYMSRDMYNLVLYGHLHSRKILSETDEYRIQTVPSIVSGCTYSDDGGMSSLPGFNIVRSIAFENGSYRNLPQLIDHPLALEINEENYLNK